MGASNRPRTWPGMLSRPGGTRSLGSTQGTQVKRTAQTSTGGSPSPGARIGVNAASTTRGRSSRKRWRGLVFVALDDPKVAHWLREFRIRGVRTPNAMSYDEIAGFIAARRILVAPDCAGIRDLAIRNGIGVITLCPELLAGHPRKIALAVSAEAANRHLWSRPKPWIVRAWPYWSTIEDLRYPEPRLEP